VSGKYFVYILASRRYGTLYIGLTNDLSRRLYQHRSGAVSSFTRDYAVHRLVHYEVHEDLTAARERERSLKGWRRDWKINLIEEANRDWSDLTPTLVQL
jgi:putative endonuclease